MNAKKTAGGTANYVRTSREFKGVERVSSLQQQEDAVSLAARLGLPPAAPDDIYVDENRSGRYPPEQWGDLAPVIRDRPTKQRRAAFSRLIAGIEAGKIKAVVVRKRNRLMRGFLLHRKFGELCKKHGVKIYCTHESHIDPLTQDETQEFGGDIMALIAEFQLKQVSTDIQAAKKYLLDHGRKSAPVRSVGYRDVPRIGEVHGHAEIIPAQKIVVLEAYRLFTEGDGKCLNAIAVEFNARAKTDANYDIANYARNGVVAKHWSIPAIRKILSNPAYIGMHRNSEGSLIPSVCYPPIVSPAVWHEAQKRLTATKQLKGLCGKRYKVHMLSGILRCAACGLPLHCKASWKHDRNGKRIDIHDHVYGCCNPACKDAGKAAGMTETAWEEFATEFLSHPRREAPDGAAASEIQIKISAIEGNLEALYADATTDYEASRKREIVYKEELARLRRKVASMEVHPTVTTTRWAELDVLARRRQIVSVVDRIEVGPLHAVVIWRDGVRSSDGKGRLWDTLSPWAFPIMLRRVMGTNFRKCLMPALADMGAWDDIGYIDVRQRCLSPNWSKLVSSEFKFRNVAAQTPTKFFGMDDVVRLGLPTLASIAADERRQRLQRRQRKGRG